MKKKPKKQVKRTVKRIKPYDDGRKECLNCFGLGKIDKDYVESNCPFCNGEGKI